MRAAPPIGATLSAAALLFTVGAAPAESLDCNMGPVARSFGESPWLVYGCDDQRSIIIVSAPGNEASPFVFSFLYPAGPDGELRLRGEGSGSGEASAAAFRELRGLTASDIERLRLQTLGVSR